MPAPREAFEASLVLIRTSLAEDEVRILQNERKDSSILSQGLPSVPSTRRRLNHGQNLPLLPLGCKSVGQERQINTATSLSRWAPWNLVESSIDSILVTLRTWLIAANAGRAKSFRASPLVDNTSRRSLLAVEYYVVSSRFRPVTTNKAQCSILARQLKRNPAWSFKSVWKPSQRSIFLISSTKAVVLVKSRAQRKGMA